MATGANVTDNIILADDIFKPDYGDPPVLYHGDKRLEPRAVHWSANGEIIQIFYPHGTHWPTRPDDWRQQWQSQGWKLTGRQRLTDTRTGEKHVFVIGVKTNAVPDKLAAWNEKVKS